MPSIDMTSEIYVDILSGLTGIQSSCIYQNQVSIKKLLNPSEGALLDRLVTVGEKYCEIYKFIETTNLAEMTEGSVGFYMLSLVEHVEKCLAPYRKTVLDLESTTPCLMLLFSRIYPYFNLLNGLRLFIFQICHSEVEGTRILEALDQHLKTSVGELKVAFHFLYQGVSKHLINQLQSWLLYGEIFDAKKEFFIEKNDASSKDPFKSYSLCSSRLPSFIRLSVAQKILNVGQTVIFLRLRLGREPGGVIDASGMCGEKADEILSAIKAASQADPSQLWLLLEDVVESVKLVVAKELHHFAMHDGDLVHQLHMVKDLFLMGRGELFHEFVNQSAGKSHMNDPNLVFLECARKVHLQEEVLKPFSLEYALNDNKMFCRLNYTVPWPLELLFTQEVLKSYNHIFRFLWRLKQIQVKMVDAWLRDKLERKLSSCIKRRQLQHNLWLLVNNLQYYLQVDVLDSQYMALESSIAASHDFEQIVAAHTKFLSNLILHSFLDSPQGNIEMVNPVQRRLNEIIKICEEFCEKLDSCGEEEMEDGVVKAIAAKFETDFSFLFQLLAALKKQAAHPCSQHLGQLLLRLDFNSYHSLKLNY